MTPDSNWLALRSSLSWIFPGGLGLGVSLALWAFAPDREVGPLFAARVTIGSVSSGAVLMGLLLLARERVRGRHSGWLLFAFAAWLVEFTLRLSGVLSDSIDGVAQRWLCASASCAALGPGFLWLWNDRAPAGQRELWVRTTRLFCVQLCAALSLTIASFTHEISALQAYHRTLQWLPVGLGYAMTWIVFAGPPAYLLLALRRTARSLEQRTGSLAVSDSPPARP